jgi:hypothetical protein
MSVTVANVYGLHDETAVKCECGRIKRRLADIAITCAITVQLKAELMDF